ncbi:MAG: hypothetical protein IJG87_02260 [Ruminococcus sp.]|nr:hypothetical protein [Ruminococcus sp.]
METVKINGNEYPAVISGVYNDAVWDGRASKSITLAIDYATAAELFVDGAAWSITSGGEEYDNSDYNVAGPITDNRDGTITVKMGKLTDLEEAYELLFGGI